MKVVRGATFPDISSEQSNQCRASLQKKNVIVACLSLALLAAVFYFSMGAGIIPIGGLNPQDAPPIMAYLAGGCYVAGGLLLVTRMRWLWVVGLIANTMVVVIFFAAYYRKPDVILSPGGMATKTIEIVLEAGLAYLVASHRKTWAARS